MGRFVDLNGKKFGKLTVIECDGSHKGKYHWRCLCDCGKTLVVSSSNLVCKQSKTCGCGFVKPIIDRTGIKYGKLTVIKYAGKNKYKQSMWLCKCDCGNEKITTGGALNYGSTKSCGCLHNKLPKGQASLNAITEKIRKQAKGRGYAWGLSKEQTINLISSPCYYCGALPNNIQRNKDHNGSFLYNGIDRVNNNKGYIIENVVTCCFTCNRAKYTKDTNNFLGWLKQLASHNKWDCDINSIKFKNYEGIN